MHITHHMAERMTQRNFSSTMVSTVLAVGNWNARGDQLTLDKRHQADLDHLLTEARRKRKQLDKEIRDLDRLRRLGRVTVVTKEDSLITVYRNN